MKLMATPDEPFAPLEFIDEGELQTFEGWLKFQGFNDPSSLSEDELATWREMFDDAVTRREAAGKVGLMNLRRPGDSLYAVSVRDGADLWLALWVKRSAKQEFFIFHPTTDSKWDPHSSLHKNGNFHMKSFDHKMLTLKRQPPASIKGSEHLGAYSGFAPKALGARCVPDDFTGVVEAPPRVLGPRNGAITVDLIEPGSGAEPHDHPLEEVGRQLFTDSAPHVLIRIFRS
jgi:hypothetical protein